MPQDTLPLKSIRPIVEVPDSSLWLLLSLIAAAVLLLAAAVFWLLRRRAVRDPKRAEALRRLDAMAWDDTKRAVYAFSFLGHFVLTAENEETFRTLLGELEPYKFKKAVPPLEESLKMRMQTFIREAHRG